jgi:fused-like protein
MIIVTEYAGHDLANLMEKKNKKGFPYEDVKKICEQIFSAMWYLREKKIMHRDLKPQNILIKDGMIKICDFGFARKLSASTNFVNSVKGTPLYIAPEILDQRHYDFKVDVWSFGIIIYELYTGAPPFYANKLQ